MTGIELFLEALGDFHGHVIFGNPGTTELPLNDLLLARPEHRYVLGLHEIPVVSMADGFAMASGKLGVVNLHVSCGVGNAMGMIYNAHCAGTPLLITAGQQDRRLRLYDPVLAGDTVSVVKPWTKWAYEVQRVEDVIPAVHKAIRLALQPPSGPVFISLPIDVQLESSPLPAVEPPQLPSHDICPDMRAIEEMASRLQHAQSPVILAGSRITESHATAELAGLAELLAAPVLTECGTSHGRLVIDSRHPLYHGTLPLWSPDVRKLLGQHDVILAVGINMLREYIYEDSAPAIPDDKLLLHLDSNLNEIGKTFRTDVGVWSGIRAGLRELMDRISARGSTDVQLQDRYAHLTEQRNDEIALLERQAESERHSSGKMTPLGLMSGLARVLPDNAIVVEEAPTTTRNVLERLGVIRNPECYFGHRGWALGWGLGCAVGAKIAWPERPALAVIGDGAAMYGIQSLWTAARESLPVVFVICNNRQYKILKDCTHKLPLSGAAGGEYLAMDLDKPNIDFVALAEGLGVPARRVTSVDEISEQAEAGFQSDSPLLLEVDVE